MKAFRCWASAAVLLPLLALGCDNNTSPQGKAPDQEARIRANLEKLAPADRVLAQKQIFCAVETENRLGGMGKPFKLTIKDQPVFLCCKGCKEAALADPEKILATVKKLQAANAPK